MEALTVAVTYGTALFEAARDIGKVEAIAGELTDLEQIFKDEKAFFDLIRNPGIGAAEKKESINAVFKGRVEEELLNFLFILVDKRRFGQFPGIVKAFHKQMNDNLGISIGAIYSAVPLSDDRLGRFEEETGKLLRKNVKLENTVDAELLGGVKILIEGKLIDASIRKRLSSLKEQLM
ncbi:MAG: ATP synthase F1 subunit delta [Clostridiales Family XIII bacterium]|jgi:ATP synthase F1 delta subunit|nr:ATP synthase F1 subunit delta [Clostridiales Family XIII bacterium]